MLSFYHNSQNNNFRKPSGAVPQGTAVAVFMHIYDDCVNNPEKIVGARLFVQQNVIVDGRHSKIELRSDLCLSEGSGVKVETDYGCRIKYEYSGLLETPLTGVYFYCFEFETETPDGVHHYITYGNNELCLGGEGKSYGGQPYDEGHHGKYFQVTVYEKDLDVPEWFRKGVIYQIFPDRFYRAQDALSRFKPNSFAYGSWYDTPMYIKERETGDIARWDFFGGNLMGVTQKLPYIESLGASIIYLNPIFDAVSNHRYDTRDYKHVDELLGGDSSLDLLFAAGHANGMRFMLDGVFSHTGSDSIYFDKEGKFGNGAYKNPDSPYRSWYRFGNNDDEYECWWGIKVMPNVEELDPTYLDYIVRNRDSVIKHWIRKGADGWRLDVADELPDEFIIALRKAADEAAAERGEQSVVLGEVWEDASNKVSYDTMRTYFTAKELHSVTNYPFRNNMLAFFGGAESSELIGKRFMALKENYPKHNFYALVNMTGTHDVERLMTMMLGITGGDREKAKKLVKEYSAVMFAFAGVPLVYYGDETALEGGKDPDNRRTYPWGKADNDMIDHFCALGAMRKANDVLSYGGLEFKDAGRMFAFERNLKDCCGIEDAVAAEKCKGFKKMLCVVSPVALTDRACDVRVKNFVAEGELSVVLADVAEGNAPLVTVSGEDIIVKNFKNYIVLGVK